MSNPPTSLVHVCVLVQIADASYARFYEMPKLFVRPTPCLNPGVTQHYRCPERDINDRSDVYPVGVFAAEMALQYLHVPGRPPLTDFSKYPCTNDAIQVA